MRSWVRCGLAAIPALALLAAVPFVNRLEPRIAGFPFFLAWLLFWVACTPVFLSAADRLRTRS